MASYLQPVSLETSKPGALIYTFPPRMPMSACFHGLKFFHSSTKVGHVNPRQSQFNVCNQNICFSDAAYLMAAGEIFWCQVPPSASSCDKAWMPPQTDRDTGRFSEELKTRGPVNFQSVSLAPGLLDCCVQAVASTTGMSFGLRFATYWGWAQSLITDCMPP